MPMIPCPSCDQSISVTVSQAGAQVDCPNCQKSIRIPNLGDLRRLAAAETGEIHGNSAALPARKSQESTTARRLIFAGLMGIAGVAAIVGLFCLVRFLSIQVPATTEIHIAEIDSMYHQVSAAQLIREWQQMEKFGLDATAPYPYKKLAIEKSLWQRNGLISLAVLMVCVGAGVVLARSDARSVKSNKSAERITS